MITLTAASIAAGATAVVFAGEPDEKRAAYDYAAGFEVPTSNLSHLDDSSSLAGFDHVVINMHGTSVNGSNPTVTGFSPSGKKTVYTAAKLAKRLRERGFKGTKVTLAICYSGSPVVKKMTFAQALSDALGIEVVGYDHLVGTPDPLFSHPVTKSHVADVPLLGESQIFKTPGNPISFTPTKPPATGSASPQVPGNPPLPPLPTFTATPWYGERK